MKSKVILDEVDFDLEDLKEELVEDDTSAVMTFTDIVKREREGVNVEHLEVRIYEGMTKNEMNRVRDEVLKEFDINGIVIIQRIGIIESGGNV
ncbi:MAG: molybdenum cofactor biosynthesis protein MoaE, partial [Thermoplasmata archaeon]